MSKVPRLEVDADDTLNLEFEGFVPEIFDCNNITILLKNLFNDGCIFNAYEIADVITKQHYGTVLKPVLDSDDNDESETSDNDDDTSSDGNDVIFSVTSVIPLNQTECNTYPVVKNIREFILKEASLLGNDSKNEILSIFDSEHNLPVLFINERFDNLPLSICSEAIFSLSKELDDVNLIPTHFILFALGTKNKETDGFSYVYPELSVFQKFVSYCIELKMESLFKNNFKTENDFDVMLIMILCKNNFFDALEKLKIGF